MNNDIAIKVDHVSKTFKLPHERVNSIKSSLINYARRKKGFETQHVLDDVSFEIKKGEFIGIVGRNGSGKSTLLKMLAGIYTPTKGSIEVNGKLTPFIELGVGFSPELSGRDNVFLNGSLLGFSRKEMEKMYDDIVAFAELERFMDQKLKNYSSGMQVRLAFSIAIRANSEILVLDEVLAVGDESFQRKCFSYFEELKRNKRTVVLVTHDMSAVERYCSRAIFIENGKVQKNGDPFLVAAAYSKSNNEDYTPVAIKDQDGEIEKVAIPSDITVQILNEAGRPMTKFTHGQTMKVILTWTKPNVQYVGVSIIRQGGEYVFGCNTYQDKWPLQSTNTAAYKVLLNLGEGDYFIKSGIFGKSDKDIIDFEEQGPFFTVRRQQNEPRWGGLTKLEYKWISQEENDVKLQRPIHRG